MSAVTERRYAAAGQVSVAERPERCGCGTHSTKVRVDGEPWIWICWLRAQADKPITAAARVNFFRDLKAPEYAPRFGRGAHAREPFWCPPTPDVLDLVHHGAFTWHRRPIQKGDIVLDRSGAHVSSAASVRVAYGALVDVGPVPWEGKPGTYKAAYFDWRETGTPHPLGGGAGVGKRDGSVWVPHTRIQLLAQLAEAGRWPELGDMPAWTCDKKIDLHRWATHINTVRGMALDRHGPTSEEYKAVKQAFSQAIALLVGTRGAGQVRVWKGDIRRTDWAMAIKDLSGCTMWRWCDELGGVARAAGRPELAPVALQNEDEIVLPEGALELFTTTPRSPTKGPLQIDQTGKRLGTFKVKR